ncbi:A disintegrin and metalloproteinase with thrombospondin motifs 9-like [Lineus longissimus]|uniref:A disintegrin and metalloproteinase with thrombospondin motifs 9-like n=1 Tax=Lineus longissimus TaxID=88925 RepID=UPI002B4C65E4
MRGVLMAVAVLLGGWPIHRTVSGFQTVSDSDKAAEYEITLPSRIDHRGRTSQIHFIDKRSTTLSWINNVQYEMAAFDRQFKLALSKGSDLIGPSFKVQRFKGNTTWLDDKIADHHHCFYRGQVMNEPGSVVAVSLCSGMSGVIRTKNGTFYIKPHHTEHIHPQHQKPHIIYREKENTQQKCHSGEDISSHATSYPWLKKNLNHTNVRHIRRKRSLAWESNIETTVVVDSTMLTYHKDDLEHYVLTLMSVVATLYRDPSISNAVNIILTKLVILEKPEDGPVIGTNAVTTLRNFCRWQHLINQGNDSDPDHHDTAVLLTRVNICRANNQCDTLGLADIGTICDSRRSCSIIEDSGLSTSFTIAHELGHQLGLPHDDDSRCQRFPELRARVYNVMAATLDYNTHPWSWSRCSAFILSEFLEHGFGRCLLDKPVRGDHHKKLEKVLKSQPGESYSVDRQCELVFGNGARVCPFMPACKRLWCTTSGGLSQGCRSRHMPWSDGTNCGGTMWCQKGDCVPRQSLKIIAGGWGRWQSYGDCSRTCGGGVKKSLRECDNPRPRNGGKYCIGENVKYKPCNIKECPDNADDRIEQCTRFNGRHFNFAGLPSTISWVPKYAGIGLKDRCKLYCHVDGHHFFKLLSNKVTDGTKCSPETTDMCVNGMCRRAGCDNRLGSDLKRDLCGVCGGDNTTCRETYNEYRPSRVRFGYNTIARIPKYSTRIHIAQHRHRNAKEDENYIALMNHQGEYILNGGYVVSMFAQKIKFGGTSMYYSGSDQAVETVNSTSILQNDLIVLVLCVGALYPPSISINSTHSLGNQTTFRWDRSGLWSNCSHECQGKRQREVRCVREYDRLPVPDRKCNKSAIPSPLFEECNTDCNLGWFIRSETECTARCGPGQIKREVICGKQTGNSVGKLDESACERDRASKPATILECTGPCADLKWKFGEWSECSTTCGGGFQYRDATCVDDQGVSYPDSECSTSKKITSQNCQELRCPDWTASDWSQCSTSCGKGVQERIVKCRSSDGYPVNDLECDEDNRPEDKQSCQVKECRKERPKPPPITTTTTLQPSTTTSTTTTKKLIVKSADKIATTLSPVHISTFRTTLAKVARVYSSVKIQLPSISRKVTKAKDILLRNPESTTEWRTGNWITCSRSCGRGYRERYVSCRDKNNVAVEESLCAHTQRPPAVESCLVALCTEWRTGDWGHCTVSCGGGDQKRMVKCIQLDEQFNFNRYTDTCEIGKKPVNQQKCNNNNCVNPNNFDIAHISSNNVVGTKHWRVGPWGQCSRSCGGGEQRRQVACFDEEGASIGCDPNQKPDGRRKCNENGCANWNNGEWGECSVTCGTGAQQRIVNCQRPDGVILSDDRCKIPRRPADTQDCNMTNCPLVTKWRTGSWSACSVNCGRGERYRDVHCIDEEKNQLSEKMCDKKKPKTVRKCHVTKCPRWSKSPWSECSISCGEGMRSRLIECKRSSRVLDPRYCEQAEKPDEYEKCFEESCSTLTWRTGPWSRCSVSCNSGNKQRLVSCFNLTSKEQVTDRFCDVNNKPKAKKKCNQPPCPFIWSTAEWSACSRTCGEGQQRRKVSCHRVTKEGWIITDQASTKCDTSAKPSEFRICSYGPCNSPYKWDIKPWKKCSADCGLGKAKRKVYCVNGDGKKQSRRRCGGSKHRPDRSKLCYLRPCYANSCKELRSMTSIRQDGHYRLIIQGHLAEVYCKGMKRSGPIEYISLKAGWEGNYAEVYGKRLLNYSSCPYNGARNINCDCAKSEYTRSGFTGYSKVRLDLKTMRLITSDFTFTSTKGANQIAYGTAGDCYSTQKCPQGKFKINLTGTNFAVSDRTRWQGVGYKPTVRISAFKGHRIIEGTCGGYCGHCSLDPTTGLMVQVVP